MNIKKTNYLLTSLIVICLIFTGSVSAQNYYKDKYSMTGYSYSMDGNKIEGDMDVAIAIDKNLDRIAGSIDYPGKNSVRVYSFLAGKDIPSPDLIKDRINSYNGSRFSDTSEDVSILGIGKLADSTANGIHVQVYGPSIVSRHYSEQPYLIRIRQTIYSDQTWVTISHIKIWANSPLNNSPLNGTEGLWVEKTIPHSKIAGSFLINMPFIGISVNTTINSFIESHSSTEASWTITPLYSAPFFYDSPDSSTNPTAVVMYLTPIAGTGTYICTGWVTAEFKFWDSVNRYYDTRTISNIPYYVTVY